MPWIVSARQHHNEWGQVHSFHPAAVIAAHQSGVGDGGAIFAAVARQVRVDAGGDGAQERGAAGKHGAGNHRDAAGDPHPGERTAVGKRHRHLKFGRRLQGDQAGEHRPVRTRLARQDRAVGQECDQPSLAQLRVKGVGVFGDVGVPLRDGRVVGGKQQRGLDELRQVLKDHRLRDLRRRLAAVTRQDDAAADLDVVVGDAARRSLEDLLPAAVNDKRAPASARVAQHFADRLRPAARDVVLQRDAARRRRPQRSGKARFGLIHAYAHRRRLLVIGYDGVEIEDEPVKPVGALQRLIGGIGLAFQRDDLVP
jgi:hypothetical protein